MPARVLVPLWIAILGALVPWASQEPEEPPSEEERALLALVDQVRRDPSGVGPGVFFELARPASELSLGLLSEAVGLLRNPDVLRAAYGAFGAFRGTPHERDAIGVLEGAAGVPGDRARARAAARGLSFFGSAAREELTAVARNGPDEDVRAEALVPLLDGLVRSGDPVDVQLVLGGLPRDPGLRVQIEAALARFESPAAIAILATSVDDAAIPVAWRVFLVDLMAQKESPVAQRAVRRAMKDPSIEVRTRALRNVAARDPDEALRLVRDVVRTGEVGPALEVVGILMSIGELHPIVAQELVDLMRGQPLDVKVAAIQSLGLLPRKASVDALHRLFEEDDDWRVRIATLKALHKLRQKESIPRLIAALDYTEGRVRDEVLRELRLLTGLDMGETTARWKTWYSGKGGGFVMPSLAEATQREGLRVKRDSDRNRTTSFYGIRVVSDRICFLIDTSGSMRARAAGRHSTSEPPSRLDVAKHELEQVLGQLLDGSWVNIVAFSDETSSWRSKAVKLDARTRPAAKRFVGRLESEGGTAIWAALERGLSELEIDTIYLLSDGGSNDLRVLRSFQAANKDRWLRVHAISVGSSSKLLERLASETGGHYVIVE